MKRKFTACLIVFTTYVITLATSCNPNPSAGDFKNTISAGPLLIIGQNTDSAKQMRLGYLNLPDSLTLKDDIRRKPIQSFILSKEDLASIEGSDYTMLSIEIGIRNFGDSSSIKQGAARPIYTLVVVPLIVKQNTNGTLDTTRVYNSQGNYVAYDYACPCINGSGCCPK